jgi:hypothetical protein
VEGWRGWKSWGECQWGAEVEGCSGDAATELSPSRTLMGAISTSRSKGPEASKCGPDLESRQGDEATAAPPHYSLPACSFSSSSVESQRLFRHGGCNVGFPNNSFSSTCICRYTCGRRPGSAENKPEPAGPKVESPGNRALVRKARSCLCSVRWTTRRVARDEQRPAAAKITFFEMRCPQAPSGGAAGFAFCMHCGGPGV